jgi:adenylosuccinate synthase
MNEEKIKRMYKIAIGPAKVLANEKVEELKEKMKRELKSIAANILDEDEEILARGIDNLCKSGEVKGDERVAGLRKAAIHAKAILFERAQGIILDVEELLRLEKGGKERKKVQILRS